MSSLERLALDTLAIHAGQAPDPVHGAVMTPIVLSARSRRKGRASTKASTTRARGNPTRDALEACLAALEGGDARPRLRERLRGDDDASCSRSSRGDHVLCGDDVYGGTFRIFDKVMKQFGLEATFLRHVASRRACARRSGRTRG